MITLNPTVAEQSRHIRNVTAKTGAAIDAWEHYLSHTRPLHAVTAALDVVIASARRAVHTLGTNPDDAIDARLVTTNERIGDEPAGLKLTAQRVTQWLDLHNGSSDEERGLRILKLAEEAGEVAQAWIGATGQNPRKGRTHEVEDVVVELCDVIVTAAVAIASLQPGHHRT